MTRWTRYKNKKANHDGTKWEDMRHGSQVVATKGTVNTHDTKVVATKGTVNTHDTNRLNQLEAVKKTAIHKDKRSENRRLKRQRRKQNNTVCFHCRMPGHGMADCPIMLQDSEQGTGICFKCGSTEHKSHTCTAKVGAGKEYMFAKCFICGEEGHLSKSCPDNPRGLFPNGGCCKLCGSVDHYKRDCPERTIKGEVTAYRVTGDVDGKLRISMDDEVSLYEDEKSKPVFEPAKKKTKVVTF